MLASVLLDIRLLMNGRAMSVNEPLSDVTKYTFLR